METENASLSDIDMPFLRRILIHALTFGLSSICLPIVLEVAAAVLMDRQKVIQNLKEDWGVNILTLSVFFLVGCLVGSIRFSISTIPPLSRSRAQRCTRAQLIELITDLRHAAQFRGNRVLQFGPNPCSSVLSLLASMGLVKESRHGYEPTSLAADSLLGSLVATLKDGNLTFIGDWSSGTNGSEFRRLVKLVETIEQHRMESSPLPNPSPARVARASIALIRADFKGVMRFLLIKSYTWNPEGAWTPVMGAEEHGDGTLLNTIKREIQEEMALRAEDIVDAWELSTVNDKRISKRVGLLTQYTYSLFAVQLRQSSSLVQHFFKEYPEVSIDFSTSVRIHHFSWQTWEEVIGSAHLAREMPTVLEALRSIQPETIPQTVSL